MKEDLENVDFDRLFSHGQEEIGFFELRYGYLCRDKQLIDLIKQMLALDYRERITAAKALEHPFFQDHKIFEPQKENKNEEKPFLNSKQLKITNKNIRMEMTRKSTLKLPLLSKTVSLQNS